MDLRVAVCNLFSLRTTCGYSRHGAESIVFTGPCHARRAQKKNLFSDPWRPSLPLFGCHLPIRSAPCTDNEISTSRDVRPVSGSLVWRVSCAMSFGRAASELPYSAARYETSGASHPAHRGRVRALQGWSSAAPPSTWPSHATARSKDS